MLRLKLLKPLDDGTAAGLTIDERQYMIREICVPDGVAGLKGWEVSDPRTGRTYWLEDGYHAALLAETDIEAPATAVWVPTQPMGVCGDAGDVAPGAQERDST